MPSMRHRALHAIADDLLARQTRSVDLSVAAPASGIDIDVLQGWFPIPDHALNELVEYQSVVARAIRSVAQFERHDPVTVLRLLFKYFGETLTADPLLRSSVRLSLARASRLAGSDAPAPAASPNLPWQCLVEEHMELLQGLGRLRPGVGGARAVRVLVDTTLTHVEAMGSWHAAEELLTDLGGTVIEQFVRPTNVVPLRTGSSASAAPAVRPATAVTAA